MDEQEPTTAEAVGGIYTTCSICFAIVAHQAGHEAWHMSRGEAVSDAYN